eukprot:TRINITY_DN4325_c2_g1_i2.p1 TRINITY_DN4325_c2_g1~~TRINITY_DN4325_c2_g1_i2.p1  ORF type:complete len:1025 (-),score=258.19 TRINITY_DN4325_c2_g1_i2:254-3328(-)
MVICIACSKADAPFACARCHSARYCSRDCQRQHWRAGHRRQCGGDGARAGSRSGGGDTKGAAALLTHDAAIKLQQELETMLQTLPAEAAAAEIQHASTKLQEMRSQWKEQSKAPVQAKRPVPQPTSRNIAPFATTTPAASSQSDTATVTTTVTPKTAIVGSAIQPSVSNGIAAGSNGVAATEHTELPPPPRAAVAAAAAGTSGQAPGAAAGLADDAQLGGTCGIIREALAGVQDKGQGLLVVGSGGGGGAGAQVALALAHDGFKSITCIESSEAAAAATEAVVSQAHMERSIQAFPMDPARLEFGANAFAAAVDCDVYQSVLKGGSCNKAALKRCSEVMRVVHKDGRLVVLKAAKDGGGAGVGSADVAACFGVEAALANAREGAYTLTKPSSWRPLSAKLGAYPNIPPPQLTSAPASFAGDSATLQDSLSDARQQLEAALNDVEAAKREAAAAVASVEDVEAKREAAASALMSLCAPRAVNGTAAAATVASGNAAVLREATMEATELAAEAPTPVQSTSNGDALPEQARANGAAAIAAHASSGQGAVAAAAAGERLPTHLPAAWLLEQQVNIGAYQVFLTLPPQWKALSARAFKVADECFGTTAVCVDEHGAKQGIRKYFYMAKGFNADAASITIRDDCVVVRVPYSVPPPGSIAAQELAANEEAAHACDDDAAKQVTAVWCRFCGAAITKKGSLRRALPLPSGRFDDVIDEMVCFEGPTAVPMTAREVSFARKGLCLVGQTFLLLHADDCHTAATLSSKGPAAPLPIASEATLGGQSLESISCARCDAPLGAQTSTGSSAPGLVLLRHRVIGEAAKAASAADALRALAAKAAPLTAEASLHLDPGEGAHLAEELKDINSAAKAAAGKETVFAGFTARDYLACELCRAAEVDRCHRMVVQVEGWDTHPILRLRIVTLRCKVALDVDYPARPAIKLLFAEEHPAATPDDTTAQCSGSCSGDHDHAAHDATEPAEDEASQVQQQMLSVCPDEYADIRASLEAAARAVPASCQLDSTHASRVSYLFM